MPNRGKILWYNCHNYHIDSIIDTKNAFWLRIFTRMFQQHYVSNVNHLLGDLNKITKSLFYSYLSVLICTIEEFNKTVYNLDNSFALFPNFVSISFCVFPCECSFKFLIP